jgi:hypothetical protein
MRKFLALALTAAALALVGTSAIPSASAANATVRITGHVTTYSGIPIHGLFVEVASLDGQGNLDKVVRTTSTGRYSITVRANTAYSITFFDRDLDQDLIDDQRFAKKSGHVAMGATDYRLNKKLHRVPSPGLVQIHGVVRNFGGAPVSPIEVRITGTAKDGAVIDKRTTTMKDGWYVVTVPTDGTYSISFQDERSTRRYVASTGHITVLDANIHLSKKLHRAPQ